MQTIEMLSVFFIILEITSTVSAISCHNVTCSRQGEVCKVKKGVEGCQCIKRCTKLGPFVCGSDNMIHKSKCHMNMKACLSNQVISAVRCSDDSIHQLHSCHTSNSSITSANSLYTGHYTVYIHQSKSASLHCNIGGNPQPAVHWIHNGRPVSPEMEGVNIHESTLSFQNAKRMFAGSYICLAVNCATDFEENPPAEQYFDVKYVPNNVETFGEVCLNKIWASNYTCPANEPKSVRWSYDHHTGACIKHKSLICEQGTNLFSTEVECNEKCMPFCDHPPDMGPCMHNFIQVGYDQDKKECILFSYGGCDGNANQFYNFEDCSDLCVRRSKMLISYEKFPYSPKLCPKRCRESLKKAFCGFNFMLRIRIIRFGSIYITARVLRVIKTDIRMPLRQLLRQNPSKPIALYFQPECQCPNLKASQKLFESGTNDFLVSGDFYGRTLMLSNGSYLAPTTRAKSIKLRNFSVSTCHSKKIKSRRRIKT